MTWGRALLAGVLLAGCYSEAAPNAAFDGAAALGYAKTFLDFGPRIPGTAAARAGGDWIIAQMRARADTVVVQEWTHRTAEGEMLPLRNILARYRPDAATRILYVTHWDTRPVANEDPDSLRRHLPIDGANDGASGVGLLIALGDVLSRAAPGMGVDLLFVDGEDFGTFDPDVDVLLGSTYFAEHPPEPGYVPSFGVVWDMIGDADLQIFQERNSLDHAAEVVRRVWAKAAELGHGRTLIAEPGYYITDDHIPLLVAGMPVIDVIDLDYPFHHSTADTFDKISAASLQIVGDVALALLR